MDNSERDSLIRETHDSVLRIVGRIDGLQSSVEQQELAIWGNGNPGLKSRVQAIEENLGHNTKFYGWLSTAVIAVIGSVCTVFLSHFLHR